MLKFLGIRGQGGIGLWKGGIDRNVKGKMSNALLQYFPLCEYLDDSIFLKYFTLSKIVGQTIIDAKHRVHRLTTEASGDAQPQRLDQSSTL